MEGKEHNEDDDKLKSDSSENKDYFDSDSDEFGLPDVDDSSSDSPFDSDYKEESDYDDSDYTYREEDDYEDTVSEPAAGYDARHLDEDEGGSNAGLIIFLILLVLALGGAAVWYFYFRKPDVPPPPPPKPKVEVIDTVQTEPEPEPMIVDDPSSTVPGQVTQLSSPTGRYYVIVASFIDDDLAMDYGKKLAKQGVGTSMLHPKSEKGFYRLAVADFTSLKDATLKAEELKSTYGNDVWVIRY